MKDDRLYLVHVSECLDLIVQYTQEGEAAFREDRRTQDAVLRNLHTLTESTQRISQELKIKYREVDWLGDPGLHAGLGAARASGMSADPPGDCPEQPTRLPMTCHNPLLGMSFGLSGQAVSRPCRDPVGPD